MNEKTAEEKIESLCRMIKDEIARWEHYRDFGGQDPFYTDGLNMNLIRNHILSYKRDIVELCKESGQRLPEDFFVATPPVTDDGYMCPKGKYKKVRTQRIAAWGGSVTGKKPKYDKEQMSFY